MRCVSPVSAWQTDSGEIVFAERGKIRRSLTLRCGQCIHCRLERSRQWAIRGMHESQLYDFNSFINLTYSDEHLPEDCSLNYIHFQKFMRRVRKHFKMRVRFYMCGEYGERYGRPHFHACLFNCFFEDRYYWRMSDSGFPLYRSPTLEKLWPFGHCEVGDVSFDSVAYIARYICKKVTGPAADDHYRIVDPDTGEIFNRVPEFTRMSLKPGIGADWYKKFRSEVYPLDRVVVNGKEVKPPRYYDELLKREDNFLSDDLEYKRYLRAMELQADNAPDRLRALEAVTQARLKSKIRSLE